MKVAVISDIHGNYRALEAVLDDISKERVDRILCGGDVVNPFLRSRETWARIKELGIATVRGNHEDYIRAYFAPEIRPEIRSAPQFRPTQLVARHLGKELADEFGSLPFEYVLPGPGGDDLYLCHASPWLNNQSYWLGIPPVMEESLRRIPARTIVAGHMHVQWQREWEDKKLVIAGSVGLPLHGRPRPEYSVLEHRRDSGWEVRHKTVSYDSEAALSEYLESGCVEEGGPIAWMLYDELACAEPRLAYFLPKALQSPAGRPSTLEDWEQLAKDYFVDLGRWKKLKPHLGARAQAL